MALRCETSDSASAPLLTMTAMASNGFSGECSERRNRAIVSRSREGEDARLVRTTVVGAAGDGSAAGRVYPSAKPIIARTVAMASGMTPP